VKLRNRGYLVENDEYNIERFSVGSFKVVVSRPKGVNPSRRFNRFIKQHIPTVEKAIRRTGIKVRLPKINIIDDGEGASIIDSALDVWSGIIGAHLRGQDSVIIANLMGMSAHTLAHEIGHWLQERLPNRSKQYWSDMMGPRMTVVSDSDVGDFLRKYFKRKKFLEMDGDDKQKYIRDREVDIRKSAIYQRMASSMLNRRWSSGTKRELDKQDREKIKRLVGKKIFISRVPFSSFHYAAKNDKEAFAEFFAEYILSGPLQSDKGMRELFRNVLGAGGHVVESTVERKK